MPIKSISRLQDEYLKIAIQYYISARSSSFSYLIPVTGNLFHHSIEMFLKAFLLKKYSPKELQEDFRHNLKKLWKQFKSLVPEQDFDRYDSLINKLAKMEEIRYPSESKGYQFFIDFRKEYYSHSKGPAIKGMREYRLNLEEIDEFVYDLLLNKVSPGWFKSQLFLGDARNQYKRDNLHKIY